jgi:hypothetical protein
LKEIRRAADRKFVQTELGRLAKSSDLVTNGLYFSASAMIGLQTVAGILEVSPKRHGSNVSVSVLLRKDG